MSADRPRGFGRKYLRGEVWWVEYWNHGRQFRESTKSRDERAADRLLKKRWKQIARDRFVGPQEDRVRFDDLLEALKVDYQINRRRSLTTLKSRVKPLLAAFAGERAVDLTEDRIERYKAARLTDDVAPATVNRELAALRRAFRLGVRHRRISSAPEIALLAEHNAREGFLEPADFEAVVGQLPDYLQDFARFAYLTGWRKGEVQTLVWSDVDRAHGRITLRREHSKNEEPRVLPLTPALGAIIERRWEARTVTARDGTASLSPRVFHRAGLPVGDFRKSWAAACEAAGRAGTLFHDLRRSAVRNLERSGVSQSVAMKVTGHKTASVYRRYRIVDEQDIREALARTEATISAGAERKVVPLSQARA